MTQEPSSIALGWMTSSTTLQIEFSQEISEDMRTFETKAMVFYYMNTQAEQQLHMVN